MYVYVILLHCMTHFSDFYLLNILKPMYHFHTTSIMCYFVVVDRKSQQNHLSLWLQGDKMCKSSKGCEYFCQGTVYSICHGPCVCPVSPVRLHVFLIWFLSLLPARNTLPRWSSSQAPTFGRGTCK